MSQSTPSTTGFVSLRFDGADAFAWVYPSAISCTVADKPIVLPCGGASAFVYITDGAGTACWEDGAEQYVSGCVLCARRTQQLTLRPLMRTRYIWLLLRNASEFAMAAGPRVDISGSQAADGFLKLWEYAQNNRPPLLHEFSSAVYTLLMDILALVRYEGGGDLVQDAAAIIEDEYHILGGVEELSERLGVSKHHLIRTFTAQAGIPPGQYLQQVRMEIAKLLLAHRKYSVEAVACMVGYSGSNYFCKVFRKETGESPGRYRAKNHPAATGDALHRLEKLERTVII